MLHLHDISKRFGRTQALSGVSLEFPAGAVTGLIGENGAGKSTLMNVIAGVIQPDSGHMQLGDAPYTPHHASDAHHSGVALVHQELNLVPSLSVAENLALGAFPQRGLGPLRWVDRRTLAEQSDEAVRRVGLDVRHDTPVGRLSPGERQLVEIAGALRRRPKVLLLDEPTTSLTGPECQRLFGLIERLCGEGLAIVYISHNLGDVAQLCGRTYVLRNGTLAGRMERQGFSERQAITLMIGQPLEEVFPERSGRPAEEVVLEVDGLRLPGAESGASLRLHRGEVLGLAGLMGSGRTELVRALFGLDPRPEGRVLVHGKPLPPGSPRAAIDAGLALVTEDRRRDGLLLDGAIRDNVALASLPRLASSPAGWVSPRRVADACDPVATRFRVDSTDFGRQMVSSLSGGNQQKVILSRWLVTEPDVLLLDEPTRGVDVGAKCEIYAEIQRLVDAGTAVLVISSEMEELKGLCDRIAVMHRGAVSGEFRRGPAGYDDQQLLAAAFGRRNEQ
ncbi:sugar ABC transporter ATP-binding protein [Botrimarina sp.]|uniref:sugar ABC transporter ATP-binding protein n=1 Tax=Botrimarina sp. TaxID=2795802 RepID=UPI0032EFAFA1